MLTSTESSINEKTRVLILNSPHNPTGKVFSQNEMLRIAGIVAKWPKVTVVSDEVYKYTVHDTSNGPHVHFARLPGMFDRTLTLSSAGKTFSVTGWQVGWIVGPTRLVKDIQTALPFLQFCASTPIQQALVGVLTTANEPYGGAATYYDWLTETYHRKSEMLRQALNAANLPVVASHGGYFLTADISRVDVPRKYLEEKNVAMNPMTKDWAFCRWLAIEHGVLSIPVSPFFSADRRKRGEAGEFVRFAFCKSDRTLKQASERLRTFAVHLESKKTI
jgi:kynurenine--oxoglutarate transaminase/cysteine-S-conjugate beta-lyase/glutamine--phenylpyruvate transaminase